MIFVPEDDPERITAMKSALAKHLPTDQPDLGRI